MSNKVDLSPFTDRVQDIAEINDKMNSGTATKEDAMDMIKLYALVGQFCIRMTSIVGEMLERDLVNND